MDAPKGSTIPLLLPIQCRNPGKNGYLHDQMSKACETPWFGHAEREQLSASAGFFGMWFCACCHRNARFRGFDSMYVKGETLREIAAMSYRVMICCVTSDRIKSRRAIFRRGWFGLLTVLATLPISVNLASADDDTDRGTPQQQLACTPDVFRLCGREIPNADRIVVCLRQNMQQLNDKCRAVFDAQANSQPRALQNPENGALRTPAK
jgi:hypothetical protein